MTDKPQNATCTKSMHDEKTCIENTKIYTQTATETYGIPAGEEWELKPKKTKTYPAWICSDCGDKYGRRKCGIATWHDGDACGICGKITATTEPRDFGHLKDWWSGVD